MSLPDYLLDPLGDPYCWYCQCYHAPGDVSFGCYQYEHDQYLDQGDEDDLDPQK